MPLFDKKPKEDAAAPMGPIQWLRNYGYYYKGLFGVLLLVVVVALAVVFMLRYDGADMRLYFITGTEVSQEDYYAFLEKVNGFVYDTDGDNAKVLQQKLLYMADEPQNDAQKKVYADIDAAIAGEDTVFFIVDDAGYDYVRERCQLQPLAFFQIISDDEYRLPLNNTPLMEGTGLADGPPVYLVMKHLEDSRYDDVYVRGRTDVVVGMAYNNDQSEENNVEISK